MSLRTGIYRHVFSVIEIHRHNPRDRCTISPLSLLLVSLCLCCRCTRFLSPSRCLPVSPISPTSAIAVSIHISIVYISFSFCLALCVLPTLSTSLIFIYASSSSCSFLSFFFLSSCSSLLSLHSFPLLLLLHFTSFPLPPPLCLFLSSFPSSSSSFLLLLLERAAAVSGACTCTQVVGGVGCNARLQQLLRRLAAARDASLGGMDDRYCIDNGAMVAYLGCLMAQQQQFVEIKDALYSQRFRTDHVKVTWRG